MFKTLITITILCFSLHASAQEFAKTIEGKKFSIDHNPDAVSPDADFEASTHQFLAAGKYVIVHPKGTFNGTWKYEPNTETLEINVNISGSAKKYKGTAQKLSNTKFIMEVVLGKDGESESLLFVEK